MNEKILVINLNQKAEIYLAQGKLEAAIKACYQALEIESNFPPICKTLGKILQRMGEIDQAKDWYIKAINQQPNLAEIYANLGSIYAQQKQWQLAIECYQEAIGIQPNFPGFYRNLGKIWQQLGKVELARDCQEQALNLEKQYTTASEYLKQGKILWEKEKTEEAIADFQDAIKLNPSLVDAYQNLGDILLKTKQLNEAINYYQKAIELKPEFWVIHHKLGKILQEIGELDAAISSFNLSIEINPNFPWSYKKLGDILEKKGELEEAEKYYQKVIELKSDAWDVRRKLVDIQLQIGKLDKAIIGCIQEIKINPNFTWFHQRLQENLSKLEPQDRAVNYYRDLVKTEPNNIKWLDGLGERLVKLQEWDEAILVYRRAIELKPNNHLFHRRLADIALQTGKLDEAIIAYQKSIEINPNLSWSFYNFGEALRKLARWDEAIIVYRRAIELEPNNHLFQRKLVAVLQEKGLLDEAIYFYKTAIEVNPNSCENYTELGKIYLQQEKLSEAIFYLLQALKINPNYDNIQEKITYILTKQGRKKAANVWKYDQKLPKDWLEKFFNLTGDWEVTSNSRESNITRINIHSPTQVNLLSSQTIDGKIHQSFQGKKAKLVGGFIVVVPNGKGCVKSGTTAVITSDNKLVTDISTGCAEIILSDLDTLPVQYIDGIVAFMSLKWLEKNYFQWFFNLVYRIDLLHRSNRMSLIDKFVFNALDKKFHKETLKALNIPSEKIIESKIVPHIKAKELIVPSFTSKQGGLRVTKWGCDFLKSVFLKPEIRERLSEKPERIYISRKLASWRRVVNEEEVVNLLDKYGFVSVTLESMSIEEQALCLGTAKFIITPHGAGLTNLIFCTPGTKVIEIFSPKYITSIYWQISNVCGLLHYYLIGENFDNLNSCKSMSYAPDILVNIDKLLKIMHLAGFI